MHTNTAVEATLCPHAMSCSSDVRNESQSYQVAFEPSRTVLPSEPLMAAVQYCDRHRDALFRFIDDPDVRGSPDA